MTADAPATTGEIREAVLHRPAGRPLGRPDPACGADLDGVHVLVMEDDFYLALDTVQALRRAGALVVGPCPNEDACLAELDRAAPDAAVVDINLGGGPSFRVARELKRRAVPFIFMTGYDETIIPSEFDGIARLQKPIEHRQMIRKLSEILAPMA